MDKFMIYECHDDIGYTCWVDGFLPSGLELISMMPNDMVKRFNLLESNKVPDNLLLDEFDTEMAQRYSPKSGMKRVEEGHLHLLRPKPLTMAMGTVNPIRKEFYNLNNAVEKQSYSLFGLFTNQMKENDEYDMVGYQNSFLDTLNHFKFDVKKEETYKNIENTKDQLTHLSEFILLSYYLPYGLITKKLNDLEFDSVDAIL